MKTVIDNLVSGAGWTATNVVVTADTWPEYAASYLSGQTKMVFAAGGIASKSYGSPIDITGKYGLSFNICADKRDPSGFRFKVRFHSGATVKEYWVPLYNDFITIQFPNTFQSIDRIEFEAVSALSVFISEVIAYTDEIPFDIMDGIKQVLDISAGEEILPVVGKLTASAGDSEITIQNPLFFDRFFCFTVGAETHMVKEMTQDTIAILTDLFDGGLILGNHTNADVKMAIPVQIQPSELEATVPGISVYSNFDTDPEENEEYNSALNDAFTTDGNNRTGTIGPYWKHIITVEGDARQQDAQEIILRIFKRTFRNKNIWINGRRAEIKIDKIKQIPYDDSTDFLAKISADIEVTIGEEIWPKEIQPTVLEVTTTAEQLIPPTP